MMLYTIVESFSPAHAGWTSYCEWRGLAFERFDSIDGILRPNLFYPPEDSDWAHIVNEANMLHLITDLPHAMRKLAQIGSGDLVGVRFGDHDIRDPGFLGFDIIDGYCHVSLLTNWGNDVEIINRSLTPNALLRNLKTAEAIFETVQTTYADDSHVDGSRIVSVYNPQANQPIKANASIATPQRPSPRI
jgi:hypothetical protein